MKCTIIVTLLVLLSACNIERKKEYEPIKDEDDLLITIRRIRGANSIIEDYSFKGDLLIQERNYSNTLSNCNMKYIYNYKNDSVFVYAVNCNSSKFTDRDLFDKYLKHSQENKYFSDSLRLSRFYSDFYKSLRFTKNIKCEYDSCFTIGKPFVTSILSHYGVPNGAVLSEYGYRVDHRNFLVGDYFKLNYKLTPIIIFREYVYQRDILDEIRIIRYSSGNVKTYSERLKIVKVNK